MTFSMGKRPGSGNCNIFGRTPGRYGLSLSRDRHMDYHCWVRGWFTETNACLDQLGLKWNKLEDHLARRSAMRRRPLRRSGRSRKPASRGRAMEPRPLYTGLGWRWLKEPRPLQRAWKACSCQESGEHSAEAPL